MPIQPDESVVFEGSRADLDPPLVSPLDWAKFVAGSLRRRRALATSVFLVIMAAAATYYRLKPASYRVEAKILEQAPPAMVAGGRVDDLPSRTAWEVIHRRDNLVALAEQTGLVNDESVESGRGLARRLLDLLRPPEVERKEEPIDALVRALDKRLAVTTESGTIEIRLDWPNAEHAYRIVQGAVQGFLEARHVQEVTSIDDVIAQIEGRSARLKGELDAAVAAAQRRAPTASTSAAAAVRARQPSEELVRLRSLLEAQLMQARATLSELHPTVVSLRADIEALSRESPQLRALRDDERRLRAEYAARLAKEGYPADAAVPDEPARLASGAAREEDPRVRDLRLQYEQLASRLTSARVDLDAARAAFKYRYNVIWPPEIPTEPHSPQPVKVLGIGFVGALLLALMAAVLPDLISGRILERWQVERQLDLGVLGETPRSTRGDP